MDTGLDTATLEERAQGVAQLRIGSRDGEMICGDLVAGARPERDRDVDAVNSGGSGAPCGRAPRCRVQAGAAGEADRRTRLVEPIVEAALDDVVARSAALVPRPRERVIPSDRRSRRRAAGSSSSVTSAAFPARQVLVREKRSSRRRRTCHSGGPTRRRRARVRYPRSRRARAGGRAHGRAMSQPLPP